MALTPDQQAQVDLQSAVFTAQVNAQAVENAKHRKVQCLNIAHTTILENKRNLPVDQRQTTVAEITAFAESLEDYVNS